MRRILLFLVLAGGGITALGVFGGGFAGKVTEEPTPEIRRIPDAAPADGAHAPVTTNDLPGQGKKGGSPGAAVEISPFKSFNQTFSKSVTFTDPKDGTQIEIPNAPTHWLRMTEVAPMRDAAGSPGVRWKAIRIVLYQDRKYYTRANAEALRANPATGRKGLEAYDITADEGFEIRTPLRPEAGQVGPTERNVIRLIKNVVIRDFVHNLEVRTSDAIVDYEAESAEGLAPVEAESKTYLVRGLGFRIDGKAQRLEILENTEYEAIDAPDDAAKRLASGESNYMSPRRLRAKGSTLIVRHTEEKVPWTDVRFEGGVHVEMAGGQQLDADSVSLRLGERATDAKMKVTTNGNGPTPVLEKMTADGEVRYDGKDEKGALLTAQTPKLVVDFRARRIQAMRLAGRSLVTYRGDLEFPGEHPADRIVSARATESILFAPDAETPDASLLDLVGAARVECGRAPTDAAPQRLAADRITLHLRPLAREPEIGPLTTAPGGGRRKSRFEWIPTSFSATGGVILDGPRLSGAAREMKGFDLDRPIYHVTAVGPDAHLEITEEPEPKKDARTNERAVPSPTAETAPRRKLLLDRLTARENVNGSLQVRAGEGGITFTGASLQYGRATGAEIRATAGQNAHLTLEGRENRDRTIEAPTIWLRNGVQERTLETTGRTRTVVYLGDDDSAPPPVASGPGRQVVELRSPSRIDISGTRRTKDVDEAISVTLIDGGAMSARVDGVVTDRLTATTIELSLIETLPGPGETGFALSGRRSEERGAPKATPSTKKADAPKTSAAASRFVLESDTLVLVIGTESQSGSAGALRRVHAKGNVRAVKDGASSKPGTDGSNDRPSQFEGISFDYDARADTGVLLGTDKKSAVVTIGREPAIDRLLSPRIDVSFKDGEMTRTVFAPPVRGVFHVYEKASAAPGGVVVKTLNQLVLESYGGPLTVEGDTATVEGSAARPVRVRRLVLDAQGRPVGDPMTITTIHLTLTTTTAFGAPNSGLKNLVATGPGTTIEAGPDSAVGDTIRYELPPGGPKGALGSEGVLRITSVNGTVRVRQRGSMLEGYDVTYDLATGRISARVKRADVKSSK